MKLTALFWWTMILTTSASTFYLVVDGRWLVGLLFYAGGFGLAVFLATWRNKRSTVSPDDTHVD